VNHGTALRRLIVARAGAALARRRKGVGEQGISGFRVSGKDGKAARVPVAETFEKKGRAGGRSWDGETVIKRTNRDVSPPSCHHAPLPERITKKRPRASGRCQSAGNPPAAAHVRHGKYHRDAGIRIRHPTHPRVGRTVTGGLTSTARLVTVGRIQSTKSGVLNTVSPSQPRPPESSPVCSQDSRQPQRHWGLAAGTTHHGTFRRSETRRWAAIWLLDWATGRLCECGRDLTDAVEQ
jgi:hypothetical protein